VLPTRLRLLHNAWMRKTLNGKHFNIVLNIGCGNDSDSEGRLYSDYLSYDWMYLVDQNIYPNLIYNKKKQVFCQEKAEKITCIPDNSVDFIISFNMLYHTVVKESILELYRIGKMDSMAAISYWHRGEIGINKIRKSTETKFKILDRFTYLCTSKKLDGRGGIMECLYCKRR